MIEDEHKRHYFLKYLALFIATLIGAFTAVYVVTDLAISRAMNPIVMMKKMDKQFDKIDDMMFVHEVPPYHMKHRMLKNHTVDFFKTPDEYKFIVNLKPFNNNPENIKVTTTDSSITISGESSTNKRNSETFTSFSQTYSLEDGIDIEKITKKHEKNKYIITIPFENND